jgi:hypothetical protein
MDVCLLCVLSGRSLCDELITRPEESLPTVARRCVIKKPRGQVGHSPRWAAVPEKIINKIVQPSNKIFITIFINSRLEIH